MGRRKSNLDKNISTDFTPSRGVAQQRSLAAEKTRNVAQSTYRNGPQKEVLRKGLTEKQVKTELWIIEGEDNFLEQSIRSQLSKVARSGDALFKEWIVERGSSGDIPESWEVFKPKIINYCLGKDLETINKYSDESWSDYVIRLKDTAKRNDLNEELIIRKLKTIRVPDRYQMILQGDLFDIDSMVKKLIEWEDVKKNENYVPWNKMQSRTSQPFIQRRFDTTNQHEIINVDKKNYEVKPNLNRRVVRCYKCGKEGHISYNCTVKDNVNCVEEDKTKKLHQLNVDNRVVTLNGIETQAIFDTGATESIIGLGKLKQLGLNAEKIADKKTFTLIDGRNLKIEHAIDISIGYNKFEKLERFYVVNDSKNMKILISNNTVKELTGKLNDKINTMPVVCNIDTKNAGPISWNRPIKSYSDRMQFKTLCIELEKGE
jgi:hypothetical protein